MSFRSRILVACVLAAAAPLVVFALGARREVGARLRAQYEARVRDATEIIRADLARQAADLDGRLAALANRVADDPVLRAALLQGADAAVLHDHARAVMPSAGLDYFVLTDERGTVLSSGHYRNDYGRAAPALPAMRAWPGPVLIAARRPDAPFLALARVRAFELGGRTFLLAGGVQVDSAFVRRLARDEAGPLAVTLTYPAGTLHSGAVVDDGGSRAQITTPFIDDAATTDDAQRAVATWSIRHSLAPLRSVQRGLDAWFAAALLSAVLLALLVGHLLAARVNRPLAELAASARRIDLDRLDARFTTRRYDEVGSLARVLDAMVQRLRTSALALRGAERRATIGDVARQVNHDIRNGLLPLRNVIHHLGEVAEQAPAELGSVFAERAPTLQSGIGYLESLASSYARLAPAGEKRSVDVNDMIRTALPDAVEAEASPGPIGRGSDAAHAQAARIRLRLEAAPLVVHADPVALRRVVENLVVNALDSLENGNGTVTVSTHTEPADGGRQAVIAVADTGTGIAPEVIERIFDDFYTTRPHGTGLGLSIVRRLVTDMGGRVRVASEPGRGTTFRIELPEAG